MHYPIKCKENPTEYYYQNMIPIIVVPRREGGKKSNFQHLVKIPEHWQRLNKSVKYDNMVYATD